MKSEIEVPEGWEVKKLGTFTRIIMGQSPPSSTYNLHGDGLPFFQGNSDFGSKFPNVRLFTSKPTKKANKNDILMSVRAPVGSLNVCNKECCIGRGLCSINSIEGVNEFLFHLLKFKKNDLIKISTGSTFSGVNKTALSKFKMVLPPITEQQKIADILSKVDEQIQQTEEIIKKTEELKKGLMQKLLTKGIGHTRFKQTELGEIPEEWEVVKLSETGDANDSIVAGPFGSNLKVCDYEEQGIPIIRLQNIERNHFLNKDMKYISKEKAEELKYHSFKSGDIVLAKLGDPIGKTCLIPKELDFGIVVADVVRIRPSEEKADYKFIEYLLNSNYCSKQLSMGTIGSTRPRVNLSDIRKLKIILPDVNEQKQIASILYKVDNQLQDNKSQLENLKQLKKGLMQDLLTGRVRVTV